MQVSADASGTAQVDALRLQRNAATSRSAFWGAVAIFTASAIQQAISKADGEVGFLYVIFATLAALVAARSWRWWKILRRMASKVQLETASDLCLEVGQVKIRTSLHALANGHLSRALWLWGPGPRSQEIIRIDTESGPVFVLRESADFLLDSVTMRSQDQAVQDEALTARTRLQGASARLRRSGDRFFAICLAVLAIVPVVPMVIHEQSTRPDPNWPIAYGSIVGQENVAIMLWQKGTRVTVQMENNGGTLHAVLAHDRVQDLPARVSFRYGGDPLREITLIEESSPYPIVAFMVLLSLAALVIIPMCTTKR